MGSCWGPKKLFFGEKEGNSFLYQTNRMMATAEYEGGTGGKIRKRPKVTSTPYDRATEVGGSGGWFSKLIDPAVRLIVRSTSRLFPSIFGKNISTNEEISETKSSHEVREQDENFVDIKLSFHYDGIDVSEQELCSRLDTIFQLGQLISHESFSKVEIGRLAELLHSRIIEQSNLPLGGYMNKDNRNEESNINLEENLGRSKPPNAAALCLPVSPADSVNKCMIRKPRGRSTSYKFSRSPYCKLFRMTNPKEYNPYKDSNVDPSRLLKLIRPSLSNIRHSGHGQALKRSRSDRDAGCFGDHARRRVRQKSCLQDFNLSTNAYNLSTFYLGQKYRVGIDLKGLDNQDCRIPSPSFSMFLLPGP